MKRINDSYKLSTGKMIYPNKGIIGLTEVDGFRIFEGYDGSWITKKDGFDEKDIELTDAELKEIALYMSNLWQTWANYLQ